MKLNLRTTIAATAFAISLLTIGRLQYNLPLEELLGDNYYMYIGLSQCVIGAYAVMSIIVFGFTLYLLS